MSIGKSISISDLYSGRDPFDAFLDHMNKPDLNPKTLKKFQKLNYLLAYLEDDKYRPEVIGIGQVYNNTGKLSQKDRIYLNEAYRYAKKKMRKHKFHVGDTVKIVNDTFNHFTDSKGYEGSVTEIQSISDELSAEGRETRYELHLPTDAGPDRFFYPGECLELAK